MMTSQRLARSVLRTKPVTIGIPGVGDRLAAGLCGNQFGQLVFETVAVLVAERHVRRIGANAQYVGVDQFSRSAEARILGMASRRQHCECAEHGQDER